MRRWPAALAGVLVLVWLAGSGGRVDAHADLVSAEPAMDSKVQQAPAVLVLHFSQGIKHEGSFILIEDGSGTRLPLTVSFDDADNKIMRGTPVSPLQPGAYKVLWQTLSADDDDFDDGSYGLTVLNPDGSDPEGLASSIEPKDSGGSSGGTIILIAVSIVVVVTIGGIAYYLRTTARRTAS